MGEEHPAFILRFDAAPETNGLNRLVNWVHGHGVLDRYAVASARRDLCDPETLEMKVDYPLLEETARWWADRGAKVEKVTEAEAEAYRKKLHSDPRGHLPGEPPTNVTPITEGIETMKVSELTKELNKGAGDPPPEGWTKQTNKLVLQALNAAGIEAKGHNSKVPADAARAVFASEANETDGTVDPADVPPHLRKD